MLLALTLICAVSLRVASAELSTGDDGRPIAIQKLTSSDGRLYSAALELDFQSKVQANLLIDTSRRITWLAKRDLAALEIADPQPTWGFLYSTFSLGNGLTISGKYTTSELKLANMTFASEELMIVRSIESDDNEEHWQEIGFDGALSLTKLFYRAAHHEQPDEYLDPTTGVDRSICSLYFNATATDPNSAGAMIIGGTDRRFYSDQIKYTHYHFHVPFLPSFGRVALLSIRLDWTEEPVRHEGLSLTRPNQIAHFDSTSIFIMGDEGMIDNYLMRHIEMRKFRTYYILSCDLDDKPNIVFNLGTEADPIELVLEPKDYVLKLPLPDWPEDRCVSAIRARRLVDRRKNRTLNTIRWSFGTSIMKKYFTVFDYGNRRLGIAHAK